MSNSEEDIVEKARRLQLENAELLIDEIEERGLEHFFRNVAKIDMGEGQEVKIEDVNGRETIFSKKGSLFIYHVINEEDITKLGELGKKSDEKEKEKTTYKLSLKKE